MLAVLVPLTLAFGRFDTHPIDPDGAPPVARAGQGLARTNIRYCAPPEQWSLQQVGQQKIPGITQSTTAAPTPLESDLLVSDRALAVLLY